MRVLHTFPFLYIAHSSLLEQFVHLLHHAEVGMDQDALQWHFALQTYGLPRPDRAGWFVIYRALGRQWGPGMPSFITIPVGDTTTVQSLLDAIEGGWQDLRLPGQVIPWRVSVIDTFRARSRNRVLESPTMVLIPLVSFADFEQRPHGLLELVFPLGLHTFATVLPSRVNWPIIRSFLAPMMPLGVTLTFVEMWLNDDLLTEELVECHNGFFAHITVTTRDLPLTHYHPAQHAWTPLLHVERSVMQAGLCQFHIHVPGGSALSFSTTLQLVGVANGWEEWLPTALQQSPRLGNLDGSTLREVHPSHRVEAVVCLRMSRHVLLLPSVGCDIYPSVILVAILCPPIFASGALFAPAALNFLGVINFLGLSSLCDEAIEEPCSCYHNGRPMNANVEVFAHGDFLSCYRGRSFTLQSEEVLSISDCEPPNHTI